MSDRLARMAALLLSAVECSVLDVIGNGSVTRNRLHWALPHIDADDIDIAVGQLIKDGAVERMADDTLRRK